MTKHFMLQACGASALLAMSSAVMAQNDTGGTMEDPVLNTTTTDPMATNTTDPYAANTMATDPLATDPLATDPLATDPLATDPMTMNTTEQEDDDDFPWGLLGLLGLAGLLGLKRRDRDEYRPTTTGATDHRTTADPIDRR